MPLLQDFDVKLSGMDVTPSLTSVFKVFQKVVTQEYRLVCTQKEAERKSQTSFDCTLPVLPLISKVLLTAAFIASFNPPSSDARYFLKVLQLSIMEKQAFYIIAWAIGTNKFS